MRGCNTHKVNDDPCLRQYGFLSDQQSKHNGILTILVESAAARSGYHILKEFNVFLPSSLVCCVLQSTIASVYKLFIQCFSDSGFLMGDSSSDNVGCVSVVMFIIFSTEDGRLSSRLSEMFT